MRMHLLKPSLTAALVLACVVGPIAGDPVEGAQTTQASGPAERGVIGADPAETSPPILGRIDPDTYRVGPGDAFAFRVSDLLDARIVRVNPEGAIVLPDVGAVVIGGLTLRDADAKVREALRPYVRGRGLVLTLHAPRRFRMTVLGEVTRPGTVTLQAPARASEAIAAAGGIGFVGARRGIQLRRDADTLRVDLDRSERAGEIQADPLVFETDVLFVPATGTWLEIHGAVPHSGRYSFAEGDRLSTLVAIAGGASPQASLPDAVLERFVDTVHTERVPIDLAAALAAPGALLDVELRDGDRLFIPSRGNWKRGAVVEVVGEVARPGIYPIIEGVDHVRAVLDRAGGLTEHADSNSARIERAVPGALRDSTLFLLARGPDGLLLEGDRELARVQSRALGVVSADLGALLLRGDTRQDVALLPGDRIFVPRRSPFVTVEGEVRRPGAVAWQAGWRVSDYVRAAGGGTKRARESRARVTLASTGQIVDQAEAGDLHPGDVLWVPARPDRNRWAGIRDLLATAAQVSTVLLVIRQATK